MLEIARQSRLTQSRFTEHAVSWLCTDRDAREVVAATIHLGMKTAAAALEDWLRSDNPLGLEATLYGDLLYQAIRSVDWVVVAEAVAETLP